MHNKEISTVIIIVFYWLDYMDKMQCLQQLYMVTLTPWQTCL